MVEVEAFGLNYERYAMHKLFTSLVRKHRIKTVLEAPALGEKAMPSMYSLSFAHQGCDVTLVNSIANSIKAWKELKLAPKKQVQVKDLGKLPFKDNQFDLSWNFLSLCKEKNPDELFSELVRVSKDKVMYVSVNCFNVGFPVHRMVHRITGVPWNHGNVRFMNPFFMKNYFTEKGLKVKKLGVVDCPCWPDSLGIRDMKLHKINKDLTTIDWKSPTVEYLQTDFPGWMKAVYVIEKLPLPLLLKLPYAHLFYIIGEKK